VWEDGRADFLYPSCCVLDGGPGPLRYNLKDPVRSTAMPSGRARKPNGPVGTFGAALQLLHPGRLAVAVPGQRHSMVVYVGVPSWKATVQG